MIVTETERLELRHLDLSDEAWMADVFRDADVMRFGPGVQSKEWVRRWLQDCLTSYSDRGFGPWAVVEKAGSRGIGYCGLFHFPDICGQPETEIGYRLAKRHWGKGYATEAVLAARDYAFHTLALSRLIAMVDPNNVASVRVAEKAGMHYEKDVMLEGFTHPDRVYAVHRWAD